MGDADRPTDDDTAAPGAVPGPDDGAAPDGAGDVEPADGAADRPDRSTRLAARVFGAYVAIGLPILLLVIGRGWWFFRDDWFFITERELDVDGLFDDHNGHWSTAPVVVFRLLYAVVGLNSYKPYQLATIVAHLVVVVCLRSIMRRYHVGPWLATVLAGSLVFLGAGREDILWGFQIGFTGSIALVLLQWVLVDHEESALDRRDVIGPVLGLVAVSASSPSIPLLAALAATLFVRRGWRAAVVNVAPVAAGYVAWSLAIGPERSPFGRPPAEALVEWVRYGVASTFHHLTGYAWSGIVLGLVVAAGTVLALVRPPADAARPGAASDASGAGAVVAAVRGRVAPVIGPLAMFGAMIVFILSASQRAWPFGPSAAGASRYLYAFIAFSLPLVAVAIQALARAWRPAVLLAGLVVIGVPNNIGWFDDPVFGRNYHTRHHDLVVYALRVPGADTLPDDVRPDPSPYNSNGLDLGFLREAHAAGKLSLPEGDIPRGVERELRLQMGLRRQSPALPLSPCTVVEAGLLETEVGDRFYLQGDVVIGLGDDVEGDPPFAFNVVDGSAITVLLPDLDLNIYEFGAGPASVCVVDDA